MKSLQQILKKKRTEKGNEPILSLHINLTNLFAHKEKATASRYSSAQILSFCGMTRKHFASQMFNGDESMVREWEDIQTVLSKSIHNEARQSNLLKNRKFSLPVHFCLFFPEQIQLLPKKKKVWRQLFFWTLSGSQKIF